MHTKKYSILVFCLVFLAAFSVNSFCQENAENGDTDIIRDSLPATLGLVKDGDTKQIADQMYVPDIYGTVEEKHQGKGDLLVVNIQDAHTDAVAQQNINAILGKLLNNYDVDSVWVEGASGVVDTSLFASFPAPKAKKSLSKFYMDAGVISGPEFFSINSRNLIHLFGAEDQRLYNENVQVFKDLRKSHKDVSAVIDGLNKKMELLKNKIYSPTLKEFNDKKESFERGDVSFSSYCSFLKDECEKNGVSIGRYKEFMRLFDMLKIERDIDFGSISAERKGLIEELTARLGREKLSDLTKMLLLFRTGSISPETFYNKLNALAGIARVDMKLYKNLTMYIRYLNVAKSLNRMKVNVEREEIEKDLSAKLATTNEARKLVDINKDFGVVSKFLALKMSRKDYDYYENNENSCSLGSVERNISEMLKQNGIHEDSPSIKDKLHPAVDKARRFYELALKRDTALVNHLLDGMKQAKTTRAVLVSGGFHTEGVTRILKERGVSYTVILPKVGSKFDEEKYVNLMLSDQIPFSDYFKKKKRPDALPGSIGMVEVVHRAEAALAVPSSCEDNARGNNFRYEYVSDLSATVSVTGEISPDKLKPAFLEGLKKRIAEALPMEKAAFMENIGRIEGIDRVFDPLRLDDDRIFVPVEIDGTTIILNLYRAGKKAEVPETALIGEPIEAEGYTVQAMNPTGFANAVLESNVLAASAGTYMVTPADAAEYLNSSTGEIREGMGDAIGIDVSKVDDSIFGKRIPVSPNREKVLVYEINEPYYESMVGLALQLREIKKDKKTKIVIVTQYPEIDQLMSTLGLDKDVHYDALVQVDKDAKDIYDNVLNAVKSAFPVVAKQDEFEKKDVVLVTPDPVKYGAVVDNRVSGTPVIIPGLKPLVDEYVSVRQILLYAKMVLVYDGNVDVLIADILNTDKYPTLKKYLAEAGIARPEQVKDLIYNPAPVKIPTGSNIGTQIKGYIEFLKAA